MISHETLDQKVMSYGNLVATEFPPSKWVVDFLLRHRNFACYLSARVLGTVAVQMQSVAIGWQSYQITGSLFDLGLTAWRTCALPRVDFAGAGHVADRYNRRNIIAWCLAAQLACALALLTFTLSNISIVWPVFAEVLQWC